MSHPSTGGIAVFGVGKYRQTADRLVSFFTGTPFQVCGMLDTASPEPYNFTPDRLRLVLRAVYPRPRVFIAGEAIEKEENEAAIEVWKEFVAEDGIEKPLLINLREDPEGRSVEEIKKIPKEKLMVELLEKRMMPHFFR